MNQPDWVPSWDQLSTAGLTLSIGWETGATKTVHVRTLPLNRKAGDDLRAAVREAATRLRDWSPTAYNPEMELDDESYAVIDREQLAADSSIMTELEQSSVSDGSIDDLNRALLFYAISVGPPDQRVVFLRRHNPISNLRRKWFGTFGDELAPVDDKLISLDLDQFDVVLVAGHGLLVFNLRQYERLFRDSPELLARTPAKVEELHQQLALTEGTRQVLTTVATSNSRIRTRLHAIVSSGRLENLDVDRLRAAMQQFGLDPDLHLSPDGLKFDEPEAMAMMELLNEDLSVGVLTETTYVIARKSPRP